MQHAQHLNAKIVEYLKIGKRMNLITTSGQELYEQAISILHDARYHKNSKSVQQQVREEISHNKVIEKIEALNR